MKILQRRNFKTANVARYDYNLSLTEEQFVHRINKSDKKLKLFGKLT